MPELQQYEYRDLINVRKEILNRFEWVVSELEQTIENLETRKLSVADAQQRIDRPLVKEVCDVQLIIVILIKNIHFISCSYSLENNNHFYIFNQNTK
jgi:hypothetical protein